MSLSSPEDAVLDNHVQSGRRFVGDDDVRIAGQGHGDDRSLTHSSTEFVWVPLHQLRVEANHLKQAGHPFPGISNRRLNSMCFDGLDDLLPDFVHRVERVHRRLEHHGDPTPPHLPDILFGQGEQVLAIKEDLSADQPSVVGQKSHQAVGERCLSAPRFAHQSQRLPTSQIEAHILDRLDLALSRRVAQRKVDHPQDGTGLICCHATHLKRSVISAAQSRIYDFVERPSREVEGAAKERNGSSGRE